MDKLWAPWRIKYIRNKRRPGCIFCQCLKERRKHRTLFATRHSLCLLNIYPYNNGHLMVAPKKHRSRLSGLTLPESQDLIKTLIRAQEILEKTLRPQGFNIGINTSGHAGAGIPGHLHIHIVPRWKGDTNFMPVIFNTKVVSQSLDELYRQLKKHVKPE